MAVTTTVTPEDIAVELGQSAPDSGSPRGAQWQLWISDALMLVNQRANAADVSSLDQDVVDYVVRKAVVARAERPNRGAVQVSTTFDDSTVSESFRDSAKPPEVVIEDAWWAMLGLSSARGKAFMVDLMPPRES